MDVRRDSFTYRSAATIGAGAGALLTVTAHPLRKIVSVQSPATDANLISTSFSLSETFAKARGNPERWPEYCHAAKVRRDLGRCHEQPIQRNHTLAQNGTVGRAVDGESEQRRFAFRRRTQACFSSRRRSGFQPEDQIVDRAGESERRIVAIFDQWTPVRLSLPMSKVSSSGDVIGVPCSMEFLRHFLVIHLEHTFAAFAQTRFIDRVVEADIASAGLQLRPFPHRSDQAAANTTASVAHPRIR